MNGAIVEPSYQRATNQNAYSVVEVSTITDLKRNENYKMIPQVLSISPHVKPRGLGN